MCKTLAQVSKSFRVPFLCFNMERLRDSALYDGNLSQLIAHQFCQPSIKWVDLDTRLFSWRRPSDRALPS